ncbi:unnamed protein product [Peronospora belbahrii]|uniref:Uncharacterized protein n=1 Tax=Peronospora belbahrii TaxID=622444 RepID=A0ABN8CSY5_9STRA|nr:unnamed protein product [Peronospora belbahrii]
MLRSSFSHAVSASTLCRVLYTTRAMSSIPSFATVDPNFNGTNPTDGFNLVKRQMDSKSAKVETIIDPLNGEAFMTMPLTQKNELPPFVESMRSCPKHGLHNPLKNIDRYVMYGEICAKAGTLFREEKVADYFAKLVQRTSPKSYFQARNEVTTRAKKAVAIAGHTVPWCSSRLLTLPIEIPVLQMMGSSVYGQQGASQDGAVMNDLLLQIKPRNTLFTGSQAVAEKLAKDLKWSD